MLAILIMILGFIFNFDRISEEFPARYRAIFERINDFIFGKIQIIEIHGNVLLEKIDILSFVYKNDVQKDDLVIINSSNKIRNNLKKHPLIESVKIKRFLPNKMIIKIKEKNIIAKFHNKEKNTFQSLVSTGEKLDFYNSKIKVPTILTDFNSNEIVSFYEKLQSNDKHNVLIPLITEFGVFFNYRMDVVLNKTILVNLPEENVDSAIQTLVDLLQNHNILNKGIKQIDLRVFGKVFLRYFSKGEPEKYIPKEEVIVLEF